MKKQHNWITISPPLAREVWACRNCYGVRVKDSHSKYHYFYQGTTHHC